MNVQIFGTKKSFDSKKAERYFKERGIKYQFVDMKEKGLSKGEFNSVCQAVGGYEKLIDPKCKDKNLLALVQYISEGDKKEKKLEKCSDYVTVPIYSHTSIRNWYKKTKRVTTVRLRVRTNSNKGATYGTWSPDSSKAYSHIVGSDSK